MSERTGIMLATLFTEKRFNTMPKPLYIQPKIEGDRLRVPIRNGHPNLLSSGGNERISIPHIREAIKNSGLNNIELDGEMYKHGVRHNEIRSIVSRTKNLHPGHENMEYHIFDIADVYEEQHRRLWRLRDLLLTVDSPHIKRVPTMMIRTLAELQICYERFLNQGYEGIIIRHPYAKYTRKKCTTLLKLKPRASEYFEIIGVKEEKDLAGNLKGTFGGFILRTSEGVTFNVGSGPTKYQRILLWKLRKRLIGTTVKIRFQNYTKVRHVPKMQSIDKEWLTQIQTLMSNEF